MRTFYLRIKCLLFLRRTWTSLGRSSFPNNISVNGVQNSELVFSCSRLNTQKGIMNKLYPYLPPNAGVTFQYGPRSLRPHRAIFPAKIPGFFYPQIVQPSKDWLLFVHLICRILDTYGMEVRPTSYCPSLIDSALFCKTSQM